MTADRPIVERHVIDSISFADERVVCSCGVECRAERDPVIPDRHEPLAVAFQAHRLGNGRPARFKGIGSGRRPSYEPPTSRTGSLPDDAAELAPVLPTPRRRSLPNVLTDAPRSDTFTR